ncbi:TonB-dependent receptor [Niastella caeni]|nr:TonB-dependent receptor [Niastella caeni]
MKKIISGVCIAITSLAASVEVFAQEIDTTTKITVLQDILVTSNRMELRKKQVPQKLDIITGHDIVMNPGSDVGDVIKKIAALDVIQRPNVATYATIRGFRPPVEPGRINPEVTVLLNGRQSGTQNLALFDPNNIERIEILKGPAGAIYGSNAMGGVINIITKRSTGKVSGNVYGGYGSFQTSEMGYSGGGNIIPKVDFNFSGTFLDRNADFRFGKGNLFRKLLGSEQVELFPATGAIKEFDTAYDGQKRNGTKLSYRTNSLRVAYQINSKWRVDVSGTSFLGRGLESSGDLRTLDAQQGSANRIYNTADISIKGCIKKHHLSLLGYMMAEENSTFNNYNGTTVVTPSPTYQRSEGIVKWIGGQMLDVFTAGQMIKFIAGFDYNEATSRTRAWNQGTAAQNFAVTAKAPTSPWSYVKTFAPFVQAHITLLHEKLIVNPGMRYDFINFGIISTPLFQNLTPKKESNRFISPSVGIQYNIMEGLAGHYNIGRAFRFAQAFEIAGYFEEYLPDNKIRITTGNPELKNEQNLTQDAGIKYNNSKRGYSFDITFFNTRVENRVRQIALTELTGQTYSDGRIIDRYLTYTNADKANIRGLEIEGSYDFGVLKNYHYGLRVFVNITRLIKAEDITKGSGTTPDVKNRIRNVAPLNVGYGIEFDNLKTFSARISGRYLSKRFAQDFGNSNPVLNGAYMKYPRYIVLDLTANYKIAKQHIVSFRISNITDENYYETRGYNMPGRFTGLRYTYRF